MTAEDLDAKFGALSSGWLSSDRQREIKSTVYAAEQLTCREFMKQLVV